MWRSVVQKNVCIGKLPLLAEIKLKAGFFRRLINHGLAIYEFAAMTKPGCVGGINALLAEGKSTHRWASESVYRATDSRQWQGMLS